MKGTWLVGLLLLGPAAQAAPPACGTDGMAVQVLGSGDGSLAMRRAGSGSLLWMDGKARVLVNAGSGTAMRFLESGAQWNDLDAIVLTNMDAAHAADLTALLHAAQTSGRNRPLPLYGPAGNKWVPSTVTAMRDLFDPVRGTYRQLGNLLSPLDRSGYKLDPHDVREPPAKLAAPRRKGPVRLPAFSNERVQLVAVPHADENIPVLAWRIQAGASSIVFDSGARNATEPLAAIAKDSTLLVSPLPPTPSQPGSRPLAETAQIARDAHTHQLLLTGRGARTLKQDEEIADTVRKTFAGNTVLADDLGCYRP